MRLFEILVPLTLAAYLSFPLLTGKAYGSPIYFLPILATFLVGAHLLFEGYRWQMIPIYILTGIILLASSPAWFSNDASEFNRSNWTAMGLLGTLTLLAVSSALPALLPVPSIPAPGGSIPVGTQTFVLTDLARPELYSGKDGPRKFIAQVWYPADPGPNAEHAPWVNDALLYGRAISSYLGLPEFFLDHLALTRSPAWQDAPVKPARHGYPIIVFSHGWNGFAAQNTGQAVELASRGFVVIAIQHTYGAVITVFPDGEIAFNNPSALPDGAPEGEYDTAARMLVNQWAGDIDYTLEALGNMDTDLGRSFWGMLEFDRIGVYGHSTGGGAAIQFCGTDPRCMAVLGMDPFMTPVSEQVLVSGVPQPAFFMFSQRWVDDTDSKNNRLFSQFYTHLDPATQVIGIRDTSHYDFSDLPMLSPIASQLGLKGPLNGKRVTEIVDEYLISFFEATLLEKPTGVFELPSKYPEVIQLH